MLSPILLYACLTYIESVETIYLAVIVILKHALDQLPEGALIDGRRACVGGKGGVSATAAAVSAATEKLDIVMQQSSELKSLIIASLKQQNGADEEGGYEHLSKRKRERLEALCAIEDRLLKSAKRRT